MKLLELIDEAVLRLNYSVIQTEHFKKRLIGRNIPYRLSTSQFEKIQNSPSNVLSENLSKFYIKNKTGYYYHKSLTYLVQYSIDVGNLDYIKEMSEYAEKIGDVNELNFYKMLIATKDKFDIKLTARQNASGKSFGITTENDISEFIDKVKKALKEYKLLSINKPINILFLSKSTGDSIPITVSIETNNNVKNVELKLRTFLPKGSETGSKNNKNLNSDNDMKILVEENQEILIYKTIIL